MSNANLLAAPLVAVVAIAALCGGCERPSSWPAPLRPEGEPPLRLRSDLLVDSRGADLRERAEAVVVVPAGLGKLPRTTLPPVGFLREGEGGVHG